MSTTKHILAIGLAKAPPMGSEEIIKAAGTHEELRNKIQGGLQQARDHGYEIEVKQTMPEDFASSIEEIKEKLHARKWDGYIVGFGVRGVPDFTDAFEKLVNAGREIRPEMPMGFNTRPDDLFETVLRMFGDVGSA